MFEVKSRSVETWGELANCKEEVFNKLINTIHAKDAIKQHLKQQKKLKKYKVHFIKESHSDYFEIEAENEYDVSSKAREFFRQNHETIEFKTKPRSKWAGEYEGYDKLSYVKVRS